MSVVVFDHVWEERFRHMIMREQVNGEDILQGFVRCLEDRPTDTYTCIIHDNGGVTDVDANRLSDSQDILLHPNIALVIFDICNAGESTINLIAHIHHRSRGCE